MATNLIKLSNMEEWEKLYNSDKGLVIDFTATWCGPCKMISPIFNALSEKFNNLIFVKVDVDEFEELVSRMDISAMPTFKCILNKNIEHTLCGADVKELKLILNKFNEKIIVESKNSNQLKIDLLEKIRNDINSLNDIDDIDNLIYDLIDLKRLLSKKN